MNKSVKLDYHYKKKIAFSKSLYHLPYPRFTMKSASPGEIENESKKVGLEIIQTFKELLKTRGFENQEKVYQKLDVLHKKHRKLSQQARIYVESNRLLAEERLPRKVRMNRNLKQKKSSRPKYKTA